MREDLRGEVEHVGIGICGGCSFQGAASGAFRFIPKANPEPALFDILAVVVQNFYNELLQKEVYDFMIEYSRID